MGTKAPAIELVRTASFDFTNLPVLSELYETKAAFLALLEDPKDVKVVVRKVRSAGYGLTTQDSIDDNAPGLYGPAQHRRLSLTWKEHEAQVNEALQTATGYELHELTDQKTIEACMALVGPTSHPALYPALMKLYRLQIELKGNDEDGHEKNEG